MHSSICCPSSSSGEEPSSAKKWACDFCTYENWVSSVRCTMCRAQRTPKMISSENNRRSSPRPSDVYHNNNNQLQPHPPPPSPSPGQSTLTATRSYSPSLSPPPSSSSFPSEGICDNVSSKWACQLCTYLNWPRAQKCVQCLTVRKKRISPTNSRGSPSGCGSAASGGAMLHIQDGVENMRIQDCNNERNSALKKANLADQATGSDSNSMPSSQSATCSTSLIAKWSCPVCTYENWPRTLSCVLCGGKKQTVNESPPEPSSKSEIRYYNNNNLVRNNRDTPSPPAAAAAAAASTCSIGSSDRGGRNISDERSSSENNYDYERRVRQLRRRLRESDWCFLAACLGVVEGDMNPVEAYLNGGGDPTRKITNPEVVLLNRDNIFETGHTLVHLAIRFHREEMLATLLSQIESGCNYTSGVKCVPSYVAPDLASAIRRHISQSIRQRKGNFPCFYITEWATYSLPPEIDDLPSLTQEQLYNELLDRDAQSELESDSIINWSDELRTRLGSKLYALWNRSAGDCLLDSVLQATWGVFDRDNSLRRAMAESLHEAGHIFYPRWKEWEIRQGLDLGFSLDESQLSDDWSGILNLASQPGHALEQIHIFSLAHVLRRPIIVYGVKYVKSWRGENLGYARFEGVYLPLLWDPSFCTRSPIALGYTRGHFCALVPPEPSVSSSVGGAAAQVSDDAKAVFLPLTEKNSARLLPLPFVSLSEMGREEELLRLWLDVAVTDGGTLVAVQRSTRPTLLVAQMTEEWLNHYRKLAQSSTAPFSSRSSSTASPTLPQQIQRGSGSVRTRTQLDRAWLAHNPSSLQQPGFPISRPKSPPPPPPPTIPPIGRRSETKRKEEEEH